jgi:hypothetical protein
MCPPSWWLRTQVRPYKTGNYFYLYERNLVLARFHETAFNPMRTSSSSMRKKPDSWDRFLK